MWGVVLPTFSGTTTALVGTLMIELEFPFCLVFSA